MSDKKHIYYKIDCEEARRLGLSGTMKDVYFFVKSFKEGCTMGLDGMADKLIVGRNTLIRTLKQLEVYGYIKSEKSGYIFNGGERLKYTQCQNVTPYQNGTGGSTKMGLGKYQNGTGGSTKMGLGTNIIGNTQQVYTNKYTKGNTQILGEFREILLKDFVEFYQKKIGRPYLPKYATQTTVCENLIDKVVSLMEFAEQTVDEVSFKEAWNVILQRGWDATDEFTHNRWTLDYIDSQFNAIINQINSKNNGNQRNSSANEGKRDEFIRAFAERYDAR